MTDAHENVAEPPATPFDFSGMPETTRDLKQTADWFVCPDSQLQRMSQWANQMEEGIGITLLTTGGAISGTVVSAREFHSGVSAALQASVDEKHSKAAADFAAFFFDEPAKASAEQVEKDREAFSGGKLVEPIYMMARYMHLKDARLSAPGQGNMPLGYTRVLLSQIAGWSVGQRWVGDA